MTIINLHIYEKKTGSIYFLVCFIFERVLNAFERDEKRIKSSKFGGKRYIEQDCQKQGIRKASVIDYDL